MDSEILIIGGVGESELLSDVWSSKSLGKIVATNLVSVFLFVCVLVFFHPTLRHLFLFSELDPRFR